MPVHPIEYRYGSREMRRIFEREMWLEYMLMVEAALADAHAAVGNIPKEAAEAIRSKASTRFVKLERVNELEAITKHEVVAVVKALAEAVGEPYGGYVHLGATSNDITDTVLALQVREALRIVERGLARLAKLTAEMALKYKDTICLGRTHGVAAIPITFGFKLAVWASELKRHLERLNYLRERVCVGKLTGAVGTMAGFGGKAFEIQDHAMKILGLKPAEITTQIVPRDGLAELVLTLSLISSTLDKMANEIRNLHRTEIRETEEAFEEATQVGSSTMPHKRNPIGSEKICGLAKIIRGFATPALENVVQEHERDLTNSSCERVMIPEVFLLLDEQLKTMYQVLSNLKVYPENMMRNIEATMGLIFSEAVMIALVRKGYDRQKAHELLRVSCLEAMKKGIHLREVLKNTEVSLYLSDEELSELFKPENYLGKAVELTERVALSTLNFVGDLAS
ncbi:MAG: adenylosuccinate lyase [Nitrososphaerota archaeon]|nr:adenylosuccinate lyase [Nitrososphaerota archaeon]